MKAKYITMKRVALILFIAFLIMPVTASAQVTTVDNLFKEFASVPEAESVKINSFWMRLAKLCVGNNPDGKIVKKINSVRIMDLESCSKDVKTRFANRASQISVRNMEDLINVNENGNKMKVLAQIKKGTIIRKLLVMCYGESDCCLLEINGKFDLNELEDVVRSQMPKRHKNR